MEEIELIDEELEALGTKNKHCYIVKATPPSQRKTRLPTMSSTSWVFSSKTSLPWCQITQFLQWSFNPTKTHPAQPWTLAPEPGALPWAMWDHGVRECCKPSQKMMFMSNYSKSYHLGEVSYDPTQILLMLPWLNIWYGDIHHALPLTFLVRQNGPEKGKEIMFASLGFPTLPPWVLMLKISDETKQLKHLATRPLKNGAPFKEKGLLKPSTTFF